MGIYMIQVDTKLVLCFDLAGTQGPEISLPRTPTHSADLQKDSFIHNIYDMDSSEKKGIIVTIFVIVCMSIIVIIGVVALILKEPSVCSHPPKPRRGWLKFDDSFDGVIRNGTLVEYSCEKGWRIKGPDLKICLITGIWDPEEKPKCEKIV